MELTYRLTRDDHQQCSKLAQARVASHAKGPLGWKGSTILFALASMLVTVLVLVWLNESGVIDSRAAATAAFGYVWGLWTMQLCGWFWRRQYWSNWLPDDSCLLGELRLRIDGDGLECADQTKSTKYSWRAFSGISENADCIVLWFDRAQGVVVPARALASEDSRRKLVDLAREHIAYPVQA
jgi:hypothetical protein